MNYLRRITLRPRTPLADTQQLAYPSWLWFAPAYKSSGLRTHYASAAAGHDEPTIYALSTPPGTSAIAIIRITGPKSLSIYRTLTKSSNSPRPRYASVRPLHHPTTNDILDPGALTLFFPSIGSLTGSDLLELHVHGSRAIIRSVLSALSTFRSTRPAEPGEFTRRAFLNGRLSLPEVEALGDTLSAVTEQQRRRAVRGKALADRYENWRRQLVEARGELEALIDFAEDQGFEESPTGMVAGVAEAVRKLQSKVILHANNAVRGELLRNGVSLSLVGAPNTGKSSLLNRIVGREAAIVSDEPGTTRDVVDLCVDIGGFMVLIGDTAGLRTGAGKVELEGIRRAQERALAADVIVTVVAVDQNTNSMPPQVEEVLTRARHSGKKIIIVVNKMDLVPPGRKVSLAAFMKQRFRGVPVFGISCMADTGIRKMLGGLEKVLAELTAPTGDAPAEELEESIGATERQRVLLEECSAKLDEFLEMAEAEDGELDVVVAAEVLRAAADRLGRVTGRGEVGDVDEVLGVVFERFCVGK